jgi:hypothetical protein
LRWSRTAPAEDPALRPLSRRMSLNIQLEELSNVSAQRLESEPRLGSGLGHAPSGQSPEESGRTHRPQRRFPWETATRAARCGAGSPCISHRQLGRIEPIAQLSSAAALLMLSHAVAAFVHHAVRRHQLDLMGYSPAVGSDQPAIAITRSTT